MLHLVSKLLVTTTMLNLLSLNSQPSLHSLPSQPILALSLLLMEPEPAILEQ